MDPQDEVTAWYTRMVSWGIPSREAKMIAKGDLCQTEALDYAKQFISEIGDQVSMLVLAGPTGVGKTVASAYVLRHAEPLPPFGGRWASDQRRCFKHASDVAEAGLYGDEHDKKLRTDMKRASALVIDDVGAELRTDVFLALFDAVVNQRYGAAGVTCLTTNLPGEEFAKRYGQRVFDRIVGRGAWFESITSR